MRTDAAAAYELFPDLERKGDVEQPVAVQVPEFPVPEPKLHSSEPVRFLGDAFQVRTVARIVCAGTRFMVFSLASRDYGVLCGCSTNSRLRLMVTSLPTTNPPVSSVLFHLRL